MKFEIKVSLGLFLAAVSVGIASPAYASYCYSLDSQSEYMEEVRQCACAGACYYYMPEAYLGCEALEIRAEQARQQAGECHEEEGVCQQTAEVVQGAVAMQLSCEGDCGASNIIDSAASLIESIPYENCRNALTSGFQWDYDPFARIFVMVGFVNPTNGAVIGRRGTYDY